MRCFAPYCKSTEESERVTFHQFPDDARLCAAWLRALGKQDCQLPDCAVVCSQHFLHDDVCETESGSTQLRPGAVPSTVLVCLICLETDSKTISIGKQNLREAYKTLTGYPLWVRSNLKQSLCVQCAQRLRNFSRFREQSLRARSLMIELHEKHKLITMQHMESIKDIRNKLKCTISCTVIPPDHYDDITHADDDKLTTINTNVGSVAVKTEEELSQEAHAASFEADITVLKEECVSPVPDYAQLWETSSGSGKTLVDSKSPLEPSTSKDRASESKVKYEITFECLKCLVEFPDEDTYNSHMATHDESNHNPHGESSIEYPQTAVDPMPWGLKEDMTRREDSPVTVESIKKENPFIEYTVSETRASETDVVPYDSHAVCEDSLKNILYQNLRDTYTSETRIHETHTSETDIHETHNDDTVFTCTSCDYTTTREDNLHIHSETHSVGKQLVCKICRHDFARKGALERHMKIHTGEKPFACKTCNYRCTFKKNLSEHEKVHTGLRPYSCKVCGFKFARKSDMVRHERTAHTREKTVSCKLCEYKCKRQNDLVYHMVTHTGERKFQCEFCDFKFARKHDLNSHKAIHTGEKPFECHMCDYKCNRKKSLVDHVRTHTKEKPYGCEVCGYQCINQNYLARHMRTHAGERPFACALCAYKFARKNQLDSHMRIVHSVA